MALSSTLPVEESCFSSITKGPLGRSPTVDTSPTKSSADSSHHTLPKIFHHGHGDQNASSSHAAAAAPPLRSALPSRPPVLPRQNSVRTRYMDMLLAMDTIPRLHNILASFFTWILLAGFVIFVRHLLSAEIFLIIEAKVGVETVSVMLSHLRKSQHRRLPTFHRLSSMN